jgi:leucyl aminopeptidase
MFKSLIIFGILFLTNLVFAGQWIGIEQEVVTKINQSKVKVFNYSKFISTKKENYYFVENKALTQLSHFIHHQYHRCGGYRVLPSHPFKRKKVVPSFLKSNIDYSLNQQTIVEEFMPEFSVDYMNSIVKHLSSYRTRYYKTKEGVEALEWIGSEWKRLTSHRNDVKIDFYHYKNHSQPTVILSIAGKNPALEKQIIILGGHGDSINTDDLEDTAPGADDNAAGIAVLSDILRILMLKNYSPEHTVQFIAYAAEEEGIQGSYELASDYRDKNIDVIGVLQFDGVNYSGPSYDMAVISDSTDKDQNKFVASLIDQYLKVNWKWDKCGYGCSDHAAWNYEMYPASYAIEATLKESNPFIHTKNDTFDKSFNHTNHASIFTKLGIAYLLELDL